MTATELARWIASGAGNDNPSGVAVSKWEFYIQDAIDASVKAERDAILEIMEAHTDWRWVRNTYGQFYSATQRAEMAIKAVRKRGT